MDEGNEEYEGKPILTQHKFLFDRHGIGTHL
jgi:hypothetical protein